MKNWFFGGFCKRAYLSKRQVSSFGQKLPKDWEAKVEKIISRVKRVQMPRPRPDGSFQSAVKDSMMLNTDQVPVYIEDHSLGQWGHKDSSEHRTVSTTGTEKIASPFN